MRLLVGVLLLLAAVPAAAQTTPPQAPEAPPAGPIPAVDIQSDNGENRLQFGANVQADARFAIDDPQNSVTDTFTLRRLPPSPRGSYAISSST